MEADVVFYSGLLLEGKMTDTLIRVARSGRPVHAVTEMVDESLLLAPEEFAGHFDPHLWMDAAGWMQAVDAVTGALTEFDPAGRDGYRERAADYRATLTELHDYARRVIGSIPERQRILVTAHDAFNYFGRAYGLEVEGIQGMSTESEAGLDRINRLVDLLVTRQIGAVFVETTIADRNVRALIEGAAARGHKVAVGGELFSRRHGAARHLRGHLRGHAGSQRHHGGARPRRGCPGARLPGTAVARGGRSMSRRRARPIRAVEGHRRRRRDTVRRPVGNRPDDGKRRTARRPAVVAHESTALPVRDRERPPAAPRPVQREAASRADRRRTNGGHAGTRATIDPQRGTGTPRAAPAPGPAAVAPEPARSPLVVRDLTIAYRRRPVLWDVDLAAADGVITGIVGPNGAGKSTLLKGVLDLVPRVSGSVSIYGQPYRRQRRLVAYVPQRESVDWDYPVSASIWWRWGCTVRSVAASGAPRHPRGGARRHGPGRHGGLRRAPDLRAVRRPAAAAVPGAGAGAGPADLLHGRAVCRGRRGYRARHRGSAATAAARRQERYSWCTTTCRP